MELEEFRLFTAWTENILTRDVPLEKKGEITRILKNAQPEEVDKMISNVERVLKKSWEDAEKQGMEKGMEKGMEQGMEKGMEQVAKKMLSEGEDIEKITKYTGLSKDEIEKLK